MDKLVVLELEGNLQTLGFQVTLEIHSDVGLRPGKIKGHLPPEPELATHLQHHWQEKYRSLGQPIRLEPCLRITGQRIIYKGSINQRIAECKESANKLRDHLRAWLDSAAFRGIDRCLREELNRDEAIRFLIRTEDKQLHKLPWHEWDFFERYSKAEIALSATEFEASKKSETTTHKEKVRILAILGNSNGIDTEVDRRKLEALPDAEVEFLVQPERCQLNDKLWEQPWDILFFAGHSETQGETGRIYINQTDSLSLNELKYGLTKAIAQGLQLAIFNSCDGLGLAHELEQLHIPQMIVMREPVPDKVAQKFLNYFLKAFANGDSLYLAQRQAREQLQGLEDKFPCASWLPVICQNPVEVPPDWLMLRGQTGGRISSQQWDSVSGAGELKNLIPQEGSLPGKGEPDSSLLLGEGVSINSPTVSPPGDTQPSSLKRSSFRTVFLASVAVTSLVMGTRYVGILEPLELQAYDYLIRQRPPELIDERILVVEVTKEDIAEHQYPLEDATVAQLLQKLKQHEPRALGLDMHRYQSRGAGRSDLISRFEQNQNFFTVCASGSSDPNYAPPPEFSEQQLRNQVGFSDVVVDSSNPKDRRIRGDLVVGEQPEDTSRTVRRQLLSYDPSLSPSPSSCSTPYSFSFQLAFRFLYEEKIQPMEVNSNQEWQFGTVVFHRLAARFGGYQRLDGQSSQIMLNYRSNQPGQRVTLKQVLSGKLDSNLVKNRIVLIGYTAPVARDYFDTPYGQMAGIWVHAHMVSQILSSVLDKRPLVWVLPQWRGFQWGDTLWVFAWSITGGLLAWCLRWRSLSVGEAAPKGLGKSLLYLGLAGGAATLVLYQVCLVILTQGGWMPLVPSALALFSTGSVLVIYQIRGQMRSRCADFGVTLRHAQCGDAQSNAALAKRL
jgi:CHASE2 domain-containing sensor protein